MTQDKLRSRKKWRTDLLNKAQAVYDSCGKGERHDVRRIAKFGQDSWNGAIKAVLKILITPETNIYEERKDDSGKVEMACNTPIFKSRYEYIEDILKLKSNVAL